jgi:hypothetical protein
MIEDIGEREVLSPFSNGEKKQQNDNNLSLTTIQMKRVR